jgi:hypothetical protein
MTEAAPWAWDELPARERDGLLRDLADWVDWLGETYSAWVVLPACWPAHEALRVELAMFWLWHRWVMRTATSPTDGIRWHSDLRQAAVAWRELAQCQHEPPARHHDQIRSAYLVRRDHYLAVVMDSGH